MSFFNFINYNNFEFPVFNWNNFLLPSYWNTNFNQSLFQFQFQQPEFNYWNCNIDTFTLTSAKQTPTQITTPKAPTTATKPKTLSSTKNIQWWVNLGYNKQKGKELMNFMRPKATGFNGNCVGVVRQAINHVYYNGAKHYTQFGKACNVGRDFLSTDSNFKKVTGVDLASINVKDIPEGVIIIYGPGYSKKHPTCGHGEISDGNGKGYSDGITHIKNEGNRTIKELWVPV